MIVKASLIFLTHHKFLRMEMKLMRRQLRCFRNEMEHDYDIGSTIRDQITPHAVSWFTGEAVQSDEDDIEDDEDEEDEGEEDEEVDVVDDDDDGEDEDEVKGK